VDQVTKDILNETFRWEVRDSDTAEYVNCFPTRSEAREFRNSCDSDVFIWDSLSQVVVAGRTNPEFDFNDLDGFMDNIEDQQDDLVSKCHETYTQPNGRWEVRDSATGKFKYAFNSRKIAREYRNDNEFIWDNVNEVKINGSVDPSVDLDNLD